jgi:hypothetical protein
MLEPKELEGTRFVLSKFPSTVGREIILQYPTSALPKVGDYATNEALMFKIMSYVGVTIEGRDEPLMLKTPQLVNNHVTDTEALMKLEWAMMSYNFTFFNNGSLSGILERVTTQLTAMLSKTLMDLSPVLRAKQDEAAQP